MLSFCLFANTIFSISFHIFVDSLDAEQGEAGLDLQDLSHIASSGLSTRNIHCNPPPHKTPHLIKLLILSRQVVILTGLQLSETLSLLIYHSLTRNPSLCTALVPPNTQGVYYLVSYKVPYLSLLLYKQKQIQQQNCML